MYLPRRFLTVDWHKFGLHVRLVDIINCAKFYRNRLSPNSTWLDSTRHVRLCRAIRDERVERTSRAVPTWRMTNKPVQV